MDEITVCPVCHVAIKPTDYFCSNCGKNLHPAPLLLTASGIASSLLGSIVLPPMGIIWGFRYLKQGDQKSKTYGIFLIVLTIIELVVVIKLTVDTYNSITSQVDKQLNNIQGF